MEWLIYAFAAIVGFVAMVTGGFWGLGGGWLIVPCLLLMGVDRSEAVAASLLQMLVSSIYTVCVQFRHIGWKKGEWGWTVAVPLCVACFAGGFFGGPLGEFLEKVFKSQIPHQCLYIVVLGWILYKLVSSNGGESVPKSPLSGGKRLTLIGISGYFIGVISSLLGIGGGTMTRPLMRLALSVPEKTTAQITRLAFFITALSGSVPYLLNDSGSLRHIALIAGMLAAGGMLGFPLGAKIHANVLAAGRDGVADKGFAAVLGIVIFSIICKMLVPVLPEAVYVGRTAVIASSLALVFFLISINVKCKRLLKENKGSSAS